MVHDVSLNVFGLVKSFELSLAGYKKIIEFRGNRPTMDCNDLSFNHKNIVLRDRVQIPG